MTRINLGVDPRELCDQHLHAEYRELPRIYPLALRFDPNADTTPQQFRLGEGHMRFFIPYGGTLRVRWQRVCNEKRYRGFQNKLSWRPFPTELCGLVPLEEIDRAIPLIRERIQQRIQEGHPEEPRWTKRESPDWLQL